MTSNSEVTDAGKRNWRAALEVYGQPRVIGIHGLERAELTVEGFDPAQQGIDDLTRSGIATSVGLHQSNRALKRINGHQSGPSCSVIRAA